MSLFIISSHRYKKNLNKQYGDISVSAMLLATHLHAFLWSSVKIEGFKMEGEDGVGVGEKMEFYKTFLFPSAF